MTTETYTFWKSEEDDLLLDLKKKNYSYKQIALEIGRTPAAIQKRYSDLVRKENIEAAKETEEAEVAQLTEEMPAGAYAVREAEADFQVVEPVDLDRLFSAVEWIVGMSDCERRRLQQWMNKRWPGERE